MCHRRALLYSHFSSCGTQRWRSSSGDVRFKALGLKWTGEIKSVTFRLTLYLSDEFRDKMEADFWRICEFDSPVRRLRQRAAVSSQNYNFSIGQAARIKCWHLTRELPSQSRRPLDEQWWTAEHLPAVFVMTEPGDMVPEPEHYRWTTLSRQDDNRDTVSVVGSL